MTSTPDASLNAAGLLPCPFCNEQPTVYSRGGAWGSKCAKKSHHYVQTYGATRSEAVENWNRRALATPQEPLSDAEGKTDLSFQARVDPWLMSCFGRVIARDKVERNHRFLEEALELVQSGGCTASEAHQLVDYVFGREIGDMNQEVGGVMNTLAALCLAYGLDMHEAGDIELARVWTKIDKIRAKQAAKPKHSPLPELPA